MFVSRCSSEKFEMGLVYEEWIALPFSFYHIISK